VADSAQSLANANAQALVTASGGKITWSQLVGLTAVAENQSGGQDIVQIGDTPAQLGQPGVGFGPWQVTPWTTADGPPNLQDAANAAWAKFSTASDGNGFSPWYLNNTGTAIEQNAPAEVTNNPGGYLPTAAQFASAISAANTVMAPPTNYSTPANAAVVAAAGGPNTLNPDTVTDPNVITPSGPAAAPGTPASTAAGSVLGNCNGSKNYINFPSVVGIGGGGLLTQCNVKALFSFMLIVSGSLLGLAGMLLVFDRSGKLMGKAGGKAAELAGAGMALVPGGEAVGAGVAAAGHRTSKAAGAQAPRQHVSRGDHEQAIYAQGVAAGQPRSQPLRPRQNAGPGSRYQDMTPGAEF